MFKHLSISLLSLLAALALSSAAHAQVSTGEKGDEPICAAVLPCGPAPEFEVMPQFNAGICGKMYSYLCLAAKYQYENEQLKVKLKKAKRRQKRVPSKHR